VRRISYKFWIGYTRLLVVSHKTKCVKLGKNASFVAVKTIDLLGVLNIKLKNVVATTPSQKYNINMTKMS